MKRMKEFIFEELTEFVTVKLPKGGFRSGTDSLLLAGFLPYQREGRALELGAGYGTVSLLAAARGKLASVDALERQPSLFECLRENAEQSRAALGDCVRPCFADLREFRPQDRYDIVFANPPYYEQGSGRLSGIPEKDDAKHELHGTILDFCLAAARALKEGGLFCVVFPLARRAALERALKSAGLGGGEMVEILPSAGEKGKLLLRSATLGEAHPPSLRTFCLFRDKTHQSPSDEAEALLRTGCL